MLIKTGKAILSPVKKQSWPGCMTHFRIRNKWGEVSYEKMEMIYMHSSFGIDAVLCAGIRRGVGDGTDF